MSRELAIGLVYGSPVILTIEERGMNNADQIVSAVERELAREGGERPYRSTMRALVATATA